jgi:hypothetical protein
MKQLRKWLKAKKITVGKGLNKKQLQDLLIDNLKTNFVPSEEPAMEIPKGWTDEDLTEKLMKGHKITRGAGVQNLPSGVQQKIEDRTLEEKDIFGLFCSDELLETILASATNANSAKVQHIKGQRQQMKEKKRELRKNTKDVTKVKIDLVEQMWKEEQQKRIREKMEEKEKKKKEKQKAKSPTKKSKIQQVFEKVKSRIFSKKPSRNEGKDEESDEVEMTEEETNDMESDSTTSEENSNFEGKFVRWN